MSDNEDLLGDDLGDQSLADYNLGNEEEEQLLADDYESGASQNVPASLGPSYGNVDIVSGEYTGHGMEYSSQIAYQAVAEAECVVPNITVEVPNAPLPDHSYQYDRPPVYGPEHAVVPPPIPAAVPMESSQIVPSEMPAPNGDMCGPRERFISERPVGAQRLPQVRDIPDSLDKVIVPRGVGRGRGWRPQRFTHPYRRNNMHRGNFNHRASFPPPQMRPNLPPMRLDNRREMRPDIRPDIRHEMRPDIRPEMRPDIRPEMRPDIHPEMRPDMHPDMRPEMHPDMRPEIRPDMRPDIRPEMRPNIHSELRPGIRPDLRPDMHPDIRPEIHQDMRPDIRPDIRQDMRPDIRPEIRQDTRPDIRQDMRPDIRPDVRQDMRPDIRPEIRPELGPEIRPEICPIIMRPELSPERPMLQEVPFRPPMEGPGANGPPGVRPHGPFGPNFQRFPGQFRPNLEEPRPNFGPNIRPNFEPRPMFHFPRQHYRPFGPPIREIAPNSISHMPQVTIRQAMPLDKGREPEVRMLPLQLPPNLPGGLAGKKVLINPHFKGNFQPPVEGPIKDIDDAAERFIAEQRNALARAANRKFTRRSPQRYIENTTIEIENELANKPPPRRTSEDDLLRRQEEFINANRAGLRRRMRSPSPAEEVRPPRSPRAARSPRRRSASPRRSPDRRRSSPPARDEESEYRRRMREQESLRERVLRAKELRRRKNAAASAATTPSVPPAAPAQQKTYDKERERQDKDKEPSKPEEPKEHADKPSSTESENKPDTTRVSPEKTQKVEKVEKVRERSPVREIAEANSTCETLTPPRRSPVHPSPDRALTPPLPDKRDIAKEKEARLLDSDDDLDLILGDIDGILSDDDDTGRFKQTNKTAAAEPRKTQTDLRSKLPPRSHADSKLPRQKIVFNEQKKRDKSPPSRAMASSSTMTEDTENVYKTAKTKQKAEASTAKSRQRITFDRKEPEKIEKEDDEKKQPFPNRRVILQTKFSQPTTKDKSVFSRIDKTDPSKPNPGIFSRAVRTAIGSDKSRIVLKKQEEPQIEYNSDSDIDEDTLLADDVGNIASVTNLPQGMTDTRLKTLAGNDVQSLIMDKEGCSAKITFKTMAAAEHFKRKFDNKMVSKSRLTVKLR